MPNAGQNLLFTFFLVKNVINGEKARKMGQIRQRACFLGLHPNSGRRIVFIIALLKMIGN